MAIPASLKTRMCQIDREDDNRVTVLVNTSGADITQDDFCVIDSVFCGVANLDSASTETLALTTEEALRVMTDAVDAGATFDTQGAKVFFDTTAKNFSDVSAVGLFEVGRLITPVDGNDNITFEKYRYAVEVTA